MRHDLELLDFVTRSTARERDAELAISEHEAGMINDLNAAAVQCDAPPVFPDAAIARRDARAVVLRPRYA